MQKNQNWWSSLVVTWSSSEFCYIFHFKFRFIWGIVQFARTWTSPCQSCTFLIMPRNLFLSFLRSFVNKTRFRNWRWTTWFTWKWTHLLFHYFSGQKSIYLFLTTINCFDCIHHQLFLQIEQLLIFVLVFFASFKNVQKCRDSLFPNISNGSIVPNFAFNSIVILSDTNLRAHKQLLFAVTETEIENWNLWTLRRWHYISIQLLYHYSIFKIIKPKK